MKRSVVSLIAFAIALLAEPAPAAMKVFACEPEWATLAEELGGDQVEVYTATTALQNPHRIQARPSLIAKVRSADLLICTGAELEVGWLPILLRQSGNPQIQPHTPGHLEAALLVPRLELPTVLDRAAGDVHPQGNPHIQTDPRNIAPVAVARLSLILIMGPNIEPAIRIFLRAGRPPSRAGRKRPRRSGALRSSRTINTGCISSSGWACGR